MNEKNLIKIIRIIRSDYLVRFVCDMFDSFIVRNKELGICSTKTYITLML